MQYTSHYVLGNSHDKMITVFLVIIAAAELQGHKPWRENAGQVVYIIYLTFLRDTFLHKTPLECNIHELHVLFYESPHDTARTPVINDVQCCVTSQTNLVV